MKAISFLALFLSLLLTGAPLVLAEPSAKTKPPAVVPAKVAAPRSSAPSKAEEPKVPSVKNVMALTHVPVIQAPDQVGEGETFQVSVLVGEKTHGMADGERIEWIRVLVNGEEFLFSRLGAEYPEARIGFPMRLKQNSLIKVEAHCSRRGTWGSEKLVHVIEKNPQI